MKRILLALLLLLSAPALAQQSVFVPATTNSVAIVGGITTGLRIVTGVAGKSIYVTSINLVGVATSVVAFVNGTGTNCGTGTASLTGAMGLGATTLASGSGYGTILVVPPGNDLCIIITAAVAPGWLAYSIF